VTIPLQDAALFTESEAHRRYIRLDPLTLRRITIRFALANLRLIRYATKSPGTIYLPTLLMLAGRDPIIDNQRTRRLVERIVSGDKQIIEYPGMSHTLEFEPDPSRYFADLAAWGRQTTAVAARPSGLDAAKNLPDWT
jgi:alpha-beta hydrolase superfamily lysophospholipase